MGKPHGRTGPVWRSKQHERCFRVSLDSVKWSATVSYGRWIVLHWSEFTWKWSKVDCSVASAKSQMVCLNGLIRRRN